MGAVQRPKYPGPPVSVESVRVWDSEQQCLGVTSSQRRNKGSVYMGESHGLVSELIILALAVHAEFINGQ